MPDRRTSVKTFGDTRGTALLDSEGPFFAPLREAFPDATENAVDPDSRPERDSSCLAFRTYVAHPAADVPGGRDA
jgi:hypothetical protein